MNTKKILKEIIDKALEKNNIHNTSYIIEVPNDKKNSYMENPQIADAINALTKKFAGEGRVLIRPSGTEPLVRVMIEGKDQKQIQEEAEKLAALIEKVM